MSHLYVKGNEFLEFIMNKKEICAKIRPSKDKATRRPSCNIKDLLSVVVVTNGTRWCLHFTKTHLTSKII